MVLTNNFIKTVDIDLGEQLGCESGQAVITIKEMTVQQGAMLSKYSDDQERLVSYFVETLPTLIIRHTFEKEEGKTMTNGEVIALLSASVSTMMYIINKVSTHFFPSEKKKSRV